MVSKALVVVNSGIGDEQLENILNMTPAKDPKQKDYPKYVKKKNVKSSKTNLL